MSQNPDTDLVFNMVAQTLTGKIGDTYISANAVSGGRAGSKRKGAVNPLMANNPFSAGIKKTKNNPGGAIPLRKFSLKTHESRKNWIRLLPLPCENLAGRDGFAIHGRGQRGSDGCIVPTDFHVVLLIHKLVKACEDAGGPAPTLAAVAIGDIEHFENLMHTA